MSKSYSIGLMTYEYRFDSHFMPLLGELNKQRQNVEKIVFINGQHNQPFNQNFRRKALNNTAYYDNTFVHMSPVFRSFSHMVNTNINLSSNDLSRPSFRVLTEYSHTYSSLFDTLKQLFVTLDEIFDPSPFTIKKEDDRILYNVSSLFKILGSPVSYVCDSHQYQLLLVCPPST